MIEIESQPVRSNERTRLLYMIAKSISQGFLQQMGCCMVTRGCKPSFPVNFCCNSSSFQKPTGYHSYMQILPVCKLLGVINGYRTVTSLDKACISKLSATFSIERGFIKNTVISSPSCALSTNSPSFMIYNTEASETSVS